MRTLSNSVNNTRFLLIIIIIMFSSCKYKDGPVISFRSADARVIGNYSATAYMIDDTDALQLWQDSVSDILFSLYHETEPTDNWWISTRVGDAFLSGNYRLLNHDTQLLIYALEENTGYPGNGPFRQGMESTWDILKCSKNRLWLLTNFEGHKYYVELQQIE